MAALNGTVLAGESSANLTPVTSAVPVHTAPQAVDAKVTGWILSVGSMLIISTNLLVAISLILLIRKRGSQSWCFVLNLACADILVGLAITGIATDGIKGTTTRMHKDKCLLRMAFVTSPCAASLLTMFLISLDRYVAIKLPLRYSRLMGKRMIAGALVLLWLLSFAVGFLPSAVRQLQQVQYNSVCTFFSVINPQSITVVFCAFFFPLLCIFIYFYLDILKIACGHQRQIRRARQAGSRISRPGRYWGHVKALRTVALLVGCFTLSWCPFFVVSIVQVLCPACELYSFIENYLWWLGLSNSLVNPLVYACWQREVRQQICALFACIKDSLHRPPGFVAAEGCHTQHPMSTQAPIYDDPLDQTLPHIVGREPHTIPLASSVS